MVSDYKRPDAPVVAIDIDGTIGQYHEHFKNFLAPYIGKNIDHIHWLDEYQGEFSEALGVEKELYRQAKLSYRQGGLKRSMPAFAYAGELTQDIHDLGAQVWVCTTRPWLRLDNIDPDTREFLRRNRIQYDGLLYGEDKYRDLVYNVGLERIVCVLEDLPEHIQQANALGIPAILRAGPHNRWWQKTAQGSRQASVNQLDEAAREIKQLIEEWKERNDWDDGRVY